MVIIRDFFQKTFKNLIELNVILLNIFYIKYNNVG